MSDVGVSVNFLSCAFQFWIIWCACYGRVCCFTVCGFCGAISGLSTVTTPWSSLSTMIQISRLGTFHSALSEVQADFTFSNQTPLFRKIIHLQNKVLKIQTWLDFNKVTLAKLTTAIKLGCSWIVVSDVLFTCRKGQLFREQHSGLARSRLCWNYDILSEDSFT